jgi:transcriptional regulator with XRE-family HTH domain
LLLTVVTFFEKMEVRRKLRFMEMKEVGIQKLGAVIRERRLARDWSITDAANAAGFHRSYWGRLEQGYYAAPAPRYLKRVAEVLEMPFEDLYALAGYETPDELPTFQPYMRAKYDLPPEAIRELESYFEFLRNQYGIAKHEPIFPPKPAKAKGDEKAVGDKTSDRRAA